MNETRETLVKNKDWKRLLELSNYSYKNKMILLKFLIFIIILIMI